MTHRWCFGEECREPQPLERFWRGGDLCTDCRREAAKERRRATKRRRYAVRIKADAAYAEKLRQKSLKSYHAEMAQPGALKARAAASRLEYRLVDERRAATLAAQSRRRERRLGKVQRCTAMGTRGFRCRQMTRHTEGRCPFHSVARPSGPRAATRRANMECA